VPDVVYHQSSHVLGRIGILSRIVSEKETMNLKSLLNQLLAVSKWEEVEEGVP
jgi:hypothetical protein